ncbi:hypothetical protein F4780DRAFT_48774 [Xylariomycetidae sp. FL0641]|nr:hypothetical protein F4780DRAFT_48774 [Xylariomycetidae sp. FL0641]
MSRLIDTLPEPSGVREKKVVVLSRSRVGTFSLYQALAMLGYKPIHMVETIQRGTVYMDLWEEALRCKYLGGGKPYGKAEFDKWLAEYDTVIEIPQYFIEEFTQFYPDAKFVLTERDLDSWIKSVQNTAVPMFKACRSFPLNAIRGFDGWLESFCRLMNTMELVYFHGKGGKAGAEDAKLDTVEGNAKAKALAPEGQLLIARLEDGFGWEQICPFLEHGIPDRPYPRGNAPAEFDRLAREMLYPKFWRAGLTALAAIVLPVVGIGAWYYV